MPAPRMSARLRPTFTTVHSTPEAAKPTFSPMPLAMPENIDWQLVVTP